MGRATAEMVAASANVSRVAVSRAFNSDASIKPAKRELILKVARELNYSPDRAARALVSGRTHLICIIVPDVYGHWESQEVDALTAALQSEGFATLLIKASIDYKMDDRLLSYVGGFNPDSVIAFVENVTPATLIRYLDRAVPIYVRYPLPEAGDPADTGLLYDRVNVVQRDGIKQAVALLQGYSCARLAFISGRPNSRASTAREQTLHTALVEHGMPAPIMVPGDYSYDAAFQATLDLFRISPQPDDIFAANDVSAFGVLDALKYELDLRVPADVKVAGFDD
ncbi:MAG: LacI family transcriptional regulator, partial [Candidatus Devosia euplotis]|nr:LacI family transcriptional regulator [Candidatus Devosia euplotis]